MGIKMLEIIFFLLLVTCWNPSWSLQTNLTMPEVPVELSITSDDDSEQELSSQLEEVDSRAGGWSSWSDWSACSRSCDGGASHQLRTCKTGSCRGEHVRYKICNMQGFIAFFAVFAAASAGLLAPAASVLQGPSSRTTLVGPEGSVISSVAPGGQVITDSVPGVVAHSAPIIAAAPAIAAYSAPLVSAPLVAGGVIGDRSVIAGPSGTIATGRTLAAPVVAAYGAPGVLAARSIWV